MNLLSIVKVKMTGDELAAAIVIGFLVAVVINVI